MNLSPIQPPPLSALQRQFLLQAMGIQRYIPRVPVPGAVPSVPEPLAALAVHESAAAPLHSITAMPAQEAVTQSLVRTGSVEPAQRRDLLPDASGPGAPAPAAPASEPVAVQRAARLLPQPAFQLLLLQTDRRLAVCVAVPPRPQTVLDRGELQLLRNLLQWLGCRLLPDAPARQFAWPLPGLATVDAGLAGQALLGFLTQAQQELGFSRLLVLGDESVESLETLLLAPDAAWQGWYAQGLAAMLARPEVKREVWQRLQTLYAGLAG